MFIPVEKCTGLKVSDRYPQVVPFRVLALRNGFQACCDLLPREVQQEVRATVMLTVPAMPKYDARVGTPNHLLRKIHVAEKLSDLVACFEAWRGSKIDSSIWTNIG